MVHPAPWYIGIRRPPYFVEQKTGLKTEVVTVAPDGQVVAGVPVDVTLTQVQWTQRPPRGRQRLLHVGHASARRSRPARGR